MPKFLTTLCAVAALIACGHTVHANDFEPAEGHYIAAAGSEAEVTFSFHDGKITNLTLHGKPGADLTPVHNNFPEHVNHYITVFRRGFSGYYHRGGFARYQYSAKWTHHGVVEGNIYIKGDSIFARPYSLNFKSHLQHHGG